MLPVPADFTEGVQGTAFAGDDVVGSFATDEGFWLDLYIFETIEEVQKIATEWLWSYDHERPNMGNGGMTPAQKLMMAA